MWASPWFRSPAPCDLWKASQKHQKRIETHRNAANFQVCKIPICRSACHICHRWETSGKKESSVQMRFQVSLKPWASESSVPAGRGWATYGAALVPVPPRHRIKNQHISCHSKSYIEHCNKSATILSLAHVVVQHEQIICNSFDCKIIRLSLLCHQPPAGGSREPALFLVSPQVVTYLYCCFGIIFAVKINRNQVRYK